MQIRNKIFPYPVLNNYADITSFKNAEFQFCYDEMVQTENELILKNSRIILTDNNLKEILIESRARATVLVECSRTLYRENFEVFEIPKDIVIELFKLKGSVEISSYIYATENIENYRSENFLEDYEDYCFKIPKYSILAIDDGITTKIEYDEKKDKKVSSIFSIIKDSTEELREMKIELMEKRIVIYLPEEQFNLYDNFKINDNFNNLFFAMLAIPALIYALTTLRSEGYSLEDVEMNYSWFSSIKAAYLKNYREELTEELYKELDIVKLAQDLLNNGTINAMDDLFNLVIKNELEEMEDE